MEWQSLWVKTASWLWVFFSFLTLLFGLQEDHLADIKVLFRHTYQAENNENWLTQSYLESSCCHFGAGHFISDASNTTAQNEQILNYTASGKKWNH